MQEKWSIAKFGSCSTVHSSSTVHPTAPALQHFTLLLFLLQFFVPSHFVLVIAFCFNFFVISYTLSTYINLSLYKLAINLTFGNTEGGQQFPRYFLFSHFLSFSLPFSATKHSSEDDNSEDVWLDLFLLEEEGCWLGFEIN